MGEASFDVCVVGGGPAGSTTAIRLAKLGHRVCLIERSTFPRAHVGESLTPGIWPIFDSLGLGVQHTSRFLIPEETFIRWSEPSVERFASDGRASGMLVDRGSFDALLLQAAKRHEVQLFQPAQITEVSHTGSGWRFHVASKAKSQVVASQFLVDATGRAGFLLRGRWQLSPRTLAVCGCFPSQRCPNASLVEAIPDGWCWGAPIPSGLYRAIVFLDPTTGSPLQRKTLESVWRSRFVKTDLFSGLADLPLVGTLITCDATTYFAQDPISEDLIRVGESCFALDPLSSSGVEKAMQSGITAATALHTMLLRPERKELCTRFYRDRQTENVSSHAAWSIDFYRRVRRFRERPFWQRRTAAPVEDSDQNVLKPSPNEVPLTLASMVGVSSEATMDQVACIVGDEICPRPALSHPSLGRPVAFIEGVELGPLMEMVGSGFDLGHLMSLWSRRVSPHQAIRIAAWLLNKRILELFPSKAVRP